MFSSFNYLLEFGFQVVPFTLNILCSHDHSPLSFRSSQ